MTRHAHAVLVLLFLGCHLTARAQFEPAFLLPLPDRIKYIDTLYRRYSATHPSDDQQRALTDLHELARTNDDVQSQIKAEVLELELAFSKDRSLIQQKINRVFQLIQLCRLKDYLELEVWILIKAGDWLFSIQRQGAGTQYYMQALENYSVVDSAYWPMSYQALEGIIIGALYYIEDYTRAKEYTERSHLMRLTGYNGMRTWDLLSQIYLNLGDYAQSEKFIHKAEEIYEASDTTQWPFEGWRGIFYGYYGKIRFFQQRYREAIPFFVEAVQICEKADQPNNVSSFGARLAKCYIEVGEAGKARELLPLIRHNLNRDIRDNTSMDYYNLLLVLGEKGATPERNRILLDSLQYWTDRHEMFKDSNQMARTQLNQEIELNKKNREQMESSIARQKNIRTLLLISLGLVGFLSLAFVVRKHRQWAKASQEALLAKTELNQLKNEMLTRIHQLEALQHTPPILPEDDTLDLLKSNPILTDDDWIRFRRLFEKAHHGFLDRLKKHYPDLTQGEIRFLALTRLSLTPKEMASLLGVGTGAVRTMKSRILKKLSLQHEENLEVVIASL